MNFFVGEFVVAKLLGKDLSDLGVCKLDNFDEDHLTLSFFESTSNESVLKKVSIQEDFDPQEYMSQTLEKYDIPKLSRIYYRQPETREWFVGRSLNESQTQVECQFLNSLKTDYYDKKDIFIRSYKPFEDPSFFIKDKINDPKKYFDNKVSFERYKIEYRSKSIGIPSILSSNIELKEHQLKTVTSVLKDPIQRYLLADEVGLGKTIEACMILKQFVMDFPSNHKTIIIVPPLLVTQWHNELRNKFHLLKDNESKKDIRIFSYSDLEQIKSNLRSVKMLVIDEAHNINNNNQIDLYQTLENNMPDECKLLLLSATPVYNNEKNYFDMLHLLDPLVYPKDGFENFKLLIQNRQNLEQIISSLRPENLMIMDKTLDKILKIDSEDQNLIKMINQLKEKVLITFDEDDDDYLEQLNNLEKYLSEIYKLDRRIISTKRSDIKYETKRDGIKFIDFEFNLVSSLLDELDDLRIVRNIRDNKFKEFFIKLFNFCNQRILNEKYIEELLSESKINFEENEQDIINKIIEIISTVNSNNLCFYENLENIINKHDDKKNKFIIFGSSNDDVQGLFLHLTEKYITHKVYIFKEGNNFANLDFDILICDRNAEEGLNLQGRNNILIFFDLPLNVNRIEQRIGRVDRFGSYSFIIYALRNVSNKYEVLWSDFLSDNLKIFNRSASSLQIFLEQEITKLFNDFVEIGFDAFNSFLDELSGDESKLENELKFIERRSRLRLANEIVDERINKLIDFDKNNLDIKNSLMGWFCDTLKIDNDDKAVKFLVSSESNLQHKNDLINTYQNNKNLKLKYSYIGHETQITEQILENNNIHKKYVDAPRKFQISDFLNNGIVDVLAVTNNYLRNLRLIKVKVLEDDIKIGQEIIRFKMKQGVSDLPVDKIKDHLIGSIDISASDPQRRHYVTYPYTCDRETLLNSSLESDISLLRSGNDFFEGLTKFSDLDERGRSFANWRYLNGYKPINQKADLFFNANIVVTPTLNKLITFYDQHPKSEFNNFIIYLKRQSDLFFPPITLNIWINEFGDLVEDSNILDTLNKPFKNKYDRDICKTLWKNLSNNSLFPFVNENWKDNIEKLNKKFKSLALENNSVREQIMKSLKNLNLIKDFQKVQHRARVKKLDAARSNFEVLNAEFDNKLNILFQEGIENPNTSFFSIGITFLSDQNLANMGKSSK